MPLRVDVTTGETVLHEVDVRLPGYIPLELARTYRSGRGAGGAFGHGWRFNLDIALQVSADRIVFREGWGRESHFVPISVGVQATHAQTGLVLEHHPNEYVVYASPLIQYIFSKRNASGGQIRLDRVEDLSENKIQFVYAGNRLVSIVDTVGREIRFEYTGSNVGSILMASPDRTDNPVRLRAFRYDMQGDLIGNHNALGRERRYVYQNHLMVSYTNRTNGTYYAQYDADERCTALWRNDNSEARLLAYDEVRQITNVLNTLGHRSVYLNALHTHVLSQIDPAGGTQHYRYDTSQQFIGYSDPADREMAFMVRDEEGLVKHLDGEARVIQYRLDDRGLASVVADALENEYRLIFDTSGHLIQLAMPTGGSWTFDRDRRGRVKEVTSPEGRRVRIKGGGGKRIVEDEIGLCYEEAYDFFGLPTEQRDGLGRVRRFQYDAEGRLVGVEIEGGYQAQFSYDAEGHLVAAGDSEGAKTTQQFDAFGRVIARTDAGDGRWDYAYDIEGRLARATNARRQTAQFEYDWQGRLQRLLDFDGAERTFSYEDDGATHRIKDQDAEAVRAYNTIEELLEEQLPGGTARKYTYGASGEIRVVEGDLNLFFEYDGDGRLKTILKDQTQLAFSYDDDGLLKRLDDGGKLRILLRHDARGRTTEIEDQEGAVHRLRYDEGNRLTMMRMASGVRMTFRYDLMDRLLERSIYGTDRTRQDQHVFDKLKPEIVVSDPLMLEGGAPGSFWATLQQGLHGLALVVNAGDLFIPLWFQDDYLGAATSDLADRMVWTCLHGPQAALNRRTRLQGNAQLRRWEAIAAHTSRMNYTEVPDAYELGYAASALRHLFLRRMCYDYHYPYALPGFGGAHQGDLGRSADDAVSGPHATGYLKPHGWARNALGTQLSQARGHARRGGLTPEEVPLFMADAVTGQ